MESYSSVWQLHNRGNDDDTLVSLGTEEQERFPAQNYLNLTLVLNKKP